MKNRTSICLSVFVLFFVSGLFGQKQSKLDQALRFIENQKTAWSLSESDISDLAVSNMYESEHNGVTHIYLIQRYKGIEIHNAITSVHITKDGKVYDSPSRFYSGINQKINTTKTKLDAIQALSQVVKHLNIANALIPKNTSRSNEGKNIISKTNFTHNDIPFKQVFCPDKSGNLRLAWDYSMDMVSSNDYWSIRIDATNGEILDQQNLIIKCNFDHPGHSRCIENQNVLESKNIPVKEALTTINTKNSLAPSAPNTYNVVPIPYVSPNDHPRELVVNPADAIASPYGWHDTNGAAGAEYTITRGNNVHAYLDRNGDHLSDNNEPNGGSNLIFDFPFDQTMEPGNYTSAATVNLFYICNKMHDVMYGFGFNEAAGNFQANNYGKGGAGNDYVFAEGQQGSGFNNATFASPGDGINGRMQMFLWPAAIETYILKPDSLVAPINSTRASGWGGAPPPSIAAEVVIANDHSNTPTMACVNGMRKSEVGGKIVLIDRGTCDFSLKAANAQDSGAVGVIICNYEDFLLNMGGAARASQVKIPAYFINKSTCDRLKLIVKNGGLTVEIKKPTSIQGPDTLDGDFDNGIISHEYGHGISMRLTGVNCLNNAEQMGEGWSDFFALAMQAKPGDVGTTPKAIGTYIFHEKPDGFGIRRRRYTTDMSINEFTYKNITSESHDLGEVWATVLWDLYWALSERYGFDPDFKNKTAGNNICIQLVIDGLKLQPCSPGFLDGRNAILKADSINNQHKNSCLIWEVFARRGMGYFANQGSKDITRDETESYLPSPICINKVLIDKKAGYYNGTTFVKNDVVKPGEQFSFTLEINNYKPGAVSNVVIKDNIPAGCKYVGGSGNPTPQINGNQLVWTLASMKSLETKRITYKLSTDPSISSTTLWYDDCEHGPDPWEITKIKGDGIWNLDELAGVDQSYGWNIQEGGLSGFGGSDDVALYKIDQIQLSGQDPSLLFYQSFNTENGFDGGVIEVSKDGFNWEIAKPEKFSMNGYTGPIDYGAFVIPNISAFSGQSHGFFPTVLSLADYNNQKIQVRFRFGNDSLQVSPDNSSIPGWFIDNIEFLNPKFYNAEVCVTTNEGDTACISSPGKGVLADSDKIVGTDNHKQKSELKIYPNPAGDYFMVKMDSENRMKKLSMRTINGQLIKTIDLDNSSNLIKVNTNGIPKGMMILEFTGDHVRSFAKLIIR